MSIFYNNDVIIIVMYDIINNSVNKVNFD